MAIFADDLKRIAMSAELAQTLSRAADYAHAQSHDQIQLEHLLLALTEDPDAAVVLTASHVEAQLLKADVSHYLGGLTERISPSGAPLAIAPDLRRILEAAAAAASQGRRRDINGAIVLAAIVGDGKSPSAHMLRAQGLTFEEAIRALQQSIAAPAAPPQPAHAPASEARPLPGPAATEDLLAAARARIHQSRGALATPPQAAHAPYATPGIPERSPEPMASPATAHDYEDQPGEPGREHEWPPEVRSSHDPQLEAHDSGAENQFQQPRYDPQAAPHYAGRPEVYGEGSDVQSDGGARYSEVARSYEEPPPPNQQPVPQAASQPRSAPRMPSAAPQSSSRWPAPVAPAWRDAEQPPHDGQGRDAFGGAPLPPPLPDGVAASHDGSPSTIEGGDHLGHPQNGWNGPDSYGSGTGATQSGLNAAYGSEPYFDDGIAIEGRGQEGRGHEGFGGQSPSSFEGHTGVPHPYREEFDQGNRGIDLPSAHSEMPQQPGVSTRGKRGRKLTETAVRALSEALPRRMRVHAPVFVEAKLPKSEIHALAAGLGGGQAYPGQPSVAMSVRLRAPDGGLMIEPASSETQWFDARSDVIESELAQWHWTVTPLRSGRERLQLIAAVRVNGPEGTVADHMLPEIVAEVRIKRRIGLAVFGLIKWFAVAGVGAAAAIYGQPLLNSVMGAAVKLWK